MAESKTHNNDSISCEKALDMSYDDYLNLSIQSMDKFCKRKITNNLINEIISLERSKQINEWIYKDENRDENDRKEALINLTKLQVRFYALVKHLKQVDMKPYYDIKNNLPELEIIIGKNKAINNGLSKAAKSLLHIKDENEEEKKPKKAN